VLTTELVRRGARRHGTRTAVISGERSLTFREVDETANRMANVLIGLGVERGTRVGLLALREPLWADDASSGVRR
jgi:fatty-acyl-CoA synthase